MVVRQRQEEGQPTQAVTLRLPVELYRWLRRDAFEREVSQVSIVVEALEKLREAG